MTWAIRAVMTILAMVLVLGALWTFGPREPLERVAAPALPEDLDAYLAATEGAIPDITPGAEKEIIWAGAPGAKTPLSIIYLHGFSATKQEIRPVPDYLAEALGANLYYTRFAGHARPGEALGEVSASDWWRDAVEALAIGRRIGERVLVIGTSTGATMGTIALSDPDAARDVAGFIAVSPNYAVKGAPLPLLTAPFGRQVLPLVLGEERSWEPRNEDIAKWWTSRYPFVALLPMGRAVQEAQKTEVEMISIPALFIFNDGDQVVDHAFTREIAARWGGDAQITNVTPGEGDTPSAHVVAGDIQSPGLTDEVTEAMRAWTAKVR